MALIEILRGLRTCGARLELHGATLRVASQSGLPADLAAAVRAHKPALLEALRRAEVMVARVPTGASLPLLTVAAMAAEAGSCVSCGEPSASRRCDLCAAAATFACERFMAQRGGGT